MTSIGQGIQSQTTHNVSDTRDVQGTQHTEQAGTNPLAGQRNRGFQINLKCPGFLKTAWKGVSYVGRESKALFQGRMSWNRLGVGSGHAAQGFFGISAFRAAFNSARGTTANSTSIFKIQHRAPLPPNANTHNQTTRTRDEANWASQGAFFGSTMNPVLSTVGGILGGVCGGVVRLFQGPPARTHDEIAGKLSDLSPDQGTKLSAQSRHFEAKMDRVVELCGQKTNNLQEALQLQSSSPGSSRFSAFSDSTDNGVTTKKLPSKESVRDYQAIRSYGYVASYSVENTDFMFGCKFLEQNPSRDNFVHLHDQFIPSYSQQEVNIDYRDRNEFATAVQQYGSSGQFYDAIDAGIQNGQDSNEFQALPNWVQGALIGGRDTRGDNTFSVSDVFRESFSEIHKLKNENLGKLASGSFADSSANVEQM